MQMHIKLSGLKYVWKWIKENIFDCLSSVINSPHAKVAKSLCVLPLVINKTAVKNT